MTSDIIVVMGVQCVGKTYYGQQLAEELGYDFFEGDSEHSAANKAKMNACKPLTDEDRAGWLATLAGHIASWHAEGRSVILTCSALKKEYRDTLRVAPVRFVYLRAPQSDVEARCSARGDHEFMCPGLVDSQFDALEEPTAEEAIVVDSTGPPTAVLATIVDAVRDRAAIT